MLLWFELFLWLTSSMHLPTVSYRCMHEVFFWREINKSESTKTLRLGWLIYRSANKVPETSKPRPSAGILGFLCYLLGSANYRVSHPPIEYFNILVSSPRIYVSWYFWIIHYDSLMKKNSIKLTKEVTVEYIFLK